MSDKLTNNDMSEAIAKLLAEQLRFNAEQLKRYAEGEKFSAAQRKLNAEAHELAAGHPKLAREPAWYHVVLMIGAFGVGAAAVKLLT